MDPTTVTTDVIIAAIAGSLIFNEVKSDIKKCAKDYIKSLVKKKKEEKKITDGLQKLKDRERKRFETAALEEEYDFEGLWEYLKTHVRSEYEKTIHYDIEKKRDALDDLFRNARKAANCGNNTEATEAVDAFLRSIIEYLRNTDWEKLSHDQRYLATVVIGGVDSIITKKTNDLAGHLNETIAQSAEDIKQSVAQDISQIAAGESTNDRFINVPKGPAVYAVPPEVSKAKAETLAGLTRAQTAWVAGDHGMGKTTYLEYLINAERSKQECRFQKVIWVPYHEDLNSSIKASLAAAETKIGDIKEIDKEDCLVVIDNANERIREELKQYHFYRVVSVCSFGGTATVRLEKNLSLAEDIFKQELGAHWNEAKYPALKGIIDKTGGHPFVASLLGIQVKRHLDANRPLSEYEEMLWRERFQIKTDADKESVSEEVANRFRLDYMALNEEEKDILICFRLLEGSDFYVYPKKIGWKANKLPMFAGLREQGFLEDNGENGYYMHEIMRDAMKHLNGDISYDSVRELVKALGDYIRRDRLHGAGMMSVYNEVMQAYALFSSLSGKEFWKKEKIEPFEYEEDYAWMTQNIFSAFDDYKFDLSHEGSKYAARLCESANRKSGLSDFKLATAYNAVGFLPTAYKPGMNTLETISLIVENLDYLRKAADIIEALKQKGELHEELEAKIVSNTGAVWQRVFRLFNAANEEPEEFEETLDDIMSHQKDAYQKAYDIRKKLDQEASGEEKRQRRRDFAKASFALATAYHFSHDYHRAIELHNDAIKMFTQLEEDGLKVDYDLFISYSRFANTKFCFARKERSLQELLEAKYYFCKAYEYLSRLAEPTRNKQYVYYEDFLKACIDLQNQNPKDILNLNEESVSIDELMKTLKEKVIRAIDEADMSKTKKDKKKIRLESYFAKGNGKDYYK